MSISLDNTDNCLLIIDNCLLMTENCKIIISGGGTGGHIYPAIAIADALKEIDSSIEILFVGAEGKMEMEKQVFTVFIFFKQRMPIYGLYNPDG